jgi:hypothetical protein
VEDSYVLDAADLTRKSLLPKEPAFRFLNLTWSSVPSGRELASIGFVVDTRDEPFARLHYQVNGNPQDYRVRLESTRPPFGGLRWWWRCPALGCEKRVQKLYLPPGGGVFACRSCHRLTYTSVQEHDARVDALVRGGLENLVHGPLDRIPVRSLLLTLKAEEKLVKKLERRASR